MQEHGSFEVKLVGQVLVLKAYDTWNLETALRMCDECKSFANQIKDEPWGTIVDLSCWEYCTPDIWEPIEKLDSWITEHNLKYEAVVINSFMQEVLVEKSHEALTHTETKFCKDIDEAFRWLSGVGTKIQ